MEPLLAWARPAAAVFTMRLCSVPPTSNPGWPAMGKALYRAANHGCFLAASSSVVSCCAVIWFMRDSPEPST